MAGRPALLAILQQPELFRLVNDFSTWHRPPVSANTAAVGVLEELGQASFAVHEAAAAGSRGYPDRLAGRPALLAIRQQPELFHIVDSFATWYRPPVSTNTAAVGVLAELGQTSVAVHEAAATGSRGYPNARSSLQLSWTLLFHGVWTDAWHTLLAQQAAIVADQNYVSATP